jgi:hypothetical protein
LCGYRWGQVRFYHHDGAKFIKPLFWSEHRPYLHDRMAAQQIIFLRHFIFTVFSEKQGFLKEFCILKWYCLSAMLVMWRCVLQFYPHFLGFTRFMQFMEIAFSTRSSRSGFFPLRCSMNPLTLRPDNVRKDTIVKKSIICSNVL